MVVSTKEKNKAKKGSVKCWGMAGGRCNARQMGQRSLHETGDSGLRYKENDSRPLRYQSKTRTEHKTKTKT